MESIILPMSINFSVARVHIIPARTPIRGATTRASLGVLALVSLGFLALVSKFPFTTTSTLTTTAIYS